MENSSPQEIFALFKKSQRILIPLHDGPDGDCVGAALAMYLLLTNMGKMVEIISTSPSYANFGFMGLDFVQNIDPSEIDFSKYDLFCALDTAGIYMLSSSGTIEVPSEIPIINIDHHATNDSFGALNYVDASSISTCGILFKLFNYWGITVSEQLAQALLLGIYSDSGSFQYEATSAEDFRMAAELMDLGASIYFLHWNLHFSVPLDVFKARGLVYKNMQINEAKRFVYSMVTLNEFVENGISLEAVWGINADLLKMLDGVDFAFTITEKKENIFGISFRSRVSDFDVSEIAEKLGGGGHKVSAGAKFFDESSIETALEKVLKAIDAVVIR